MPGWHIHMDVARKALGSLATNREAAGILRSGGPSASDLTNLARNNAAYVALGAIGPDIFFLLPDFKPPSGTMLWGAANTIKEIYSWWDDNFLGPYEAQLGPIAANTADEINAISGGLVGALDGIFARAFSFLMDAVMTMFVRNYDVFSFLGSGVQSAYDEQTFFWSDMLHYRKTYEFSQYLWAKAGGQHNERFKAFALGWMSHLATDVAGHCFVNEKSGGPYRLHWQRHHLVENHMDAKVYDNEHGAAPIYQMLSCSALHLWIAFNPDGSSRVNFFDAQPGPSYDPADTTSAILDRKSKWDFDSDIPADLSAFIADALREFYTPGNTGAPDAASTNPMATDRSTGQCAAHPTILEDLNPGSAGWIRPENVTTTYWWLYRYVKWTTTDYFKIRRPDPPNIIMVPAFPSPPGVGESDPGPGASDDNAWHDFLEMLLAILAWIAYLGEVAVWAASVLPGIIASAGTAPVRELLYEYLEIPLYNAWLALHWYLAMSGFTSPMTEEINAGLITLGIGPGDVWGAVQASLNDLSGGLHAPATGSEPSGRDLDQVFPIDEVADPPGMLTQFIDTLRGTLCHSSESPSEFRRPWLWPGTDNNGDPVPSEPPPSYPASPYMSGQDVSVLMGSSPGSNTVRHEYEASPNEDQTVEVSRRRLPAGQHMGDPIDYTAYVVAWLTRDSVGPIANFNLDADRGYGYLCWDWVRVKDDRKHTFRAAPSAFRGQADDRHYQAPLSPGSGWCDEDLLHQPPPASSPQVHDPRRQPRPKDVSIRYIDREEKYQ